MAAWQFDLHVIPCNSIHTVFSELPETIAEEQFSGSDWWASSSISIDDLKERFSCLLPKAPSWSSKIEKWGSEDGNRVDLVLGDAGIEDVYVRIDIRQPAKKFIKAVVELARSLDCLFISGSRELLIPDVSIVIAAVRNSQAGKFVSNPTQFFDDLGRQK